VAVNDVNLKVQRGHIHALIGPNGAGKTTCFNLLTKFLTPTRGQILFNGHDITREKPAHIARRGIVRSFQISAVFPAPDACWRTCAWRCSASWAPRSLLEVRALADQLNARAHGTARRSRPGRVRDT
jgi:ABC-type uncharacterized transport system ATPase subunit